MATQGTSSPSCTGSTTSCSDPNKVGTDKSSADLSQADETSSATVAVDAASDDGGKTELMMIQTLPYGMTKKKSLGLMMANSNLLPL
jgi:hypothetical protein